MHAADFHADEILMQRLAAAYDAKLFLDEAAAADDDFLKVCHLPRMTKNLSNAVLNRLTPISLPCAAGAGGHEGGARKHSAGRVLPADGGACMAVAGKTVPT